MITQERLKETLCYDPETGVFTWAINAGSRKPAGSICNTAHKYGTLVVRIDKKKYLLHRLAWLWVYGEFPSCSVSHINGVNSDNRIKNLRLATPMQTQYRKPKLQYKKTNFKGVYARTRFYAVITVDGENIHLGSFDTEQEARQAYCLAAQKYFGEFANFGYGVYGEPDPVVKAI